jgi:uncharacterized protein (TIGR02246 family)
MPAMGQQEARALYDSLIAGWNNHDGAAMAGPFAEDGVVIGFDGSVSSGRKTIETEMSSIFADHETGRYAVKVHSVRSLGSQAMILRAIAGLVPPDQTRSTPRPTLTRPSWPNSTRANGRSCFSRTRPHSSMAAPNWSRT